MNDLKRIIKLLFKNKQSEEIPKKIEVKYRQFVTPEHQEAFNQWCKELNVSILYDRNNEFG
jgi:hypothetical protein